MKIIPAIDLMSSQVVRLYQGNPDLKTVYSNDPVGIAKRWEEHGADMLHVVDLDATLGIGSNMTVIRKILKNVSIPIEVAGGLRSESSVLDAAKISERVVIGTLAFNNKKLLKKLSMLLEPERIVISVDHINGMIVTHGWQQKTQTSLIDAAKEFFEMGFTEFLLTSTDRDGTLNGPDLVYLENICSVIPGSNVIASGGISKIGDVLDVKERNAFGVILGKALYENKISIKEAKREA